MPDIMLSDLTCRDPRADRTLVVTERGAKAVAGRRLQGSPPLTLKIDRNGPTALVTTFSPM
jgi:hypothetical protein